VITAITVDGGYSATCGVTVTQPVTGVKLNKTSTILKKGDSEILTALVSSTDATSKAVTLSFSNPAAAKVDTTGKVTGVSKEASG
jgi:uncharacterized protein YjdB